MSQLPPLFRPIAKYADFNGRANRAEFWWFIPVIFLIQVAIVMLIVSPAFKPGDYSHPDVDVLLRNYLLYGNWLGLFGLFILLPKIAVYVRRLHDTGRTGWWFVMPVIVAIIAEVVFVSVKGEALMHLAEQMGEKMEALQAANGNPAMFDPIEIFKLELPIFRMALPWVGLPAMASSLLLWFFCALPGTKGNNRFGPAPAKG